MASLWMLLAAFLFAGMGACVKLASSTFSTSEIVMYRGLVGTVLLLAMLRLQGGTLRTAFPREHLWRSFVGVVSLWLWFFAIGKLPLATAVTLNYMAPIWMAAYLFVKGLMHARHRVAWPLLAAIGASFIGVTLVLRPAVEAQQWVGGMVGLCSSVLSAMAYMQVRRLGLMGEPELRVVFYFSLMSCVAGALANAVSGDGWHHVSWHSAALLLGIGGSAMCAQIAMTRAYRIGKVLVVANLQYVGIVFSSLLGIVLWHDAFDWHVWLGMGVILASGMAASFYNTRAAST